VVVVGNHAISGGQIHVDEAMRSKKLHAARQLQTKELIMGKWGRRSQVS
jgi:hypothetical protein